MWRSSRLNSGDPSLQPVRYRWRPLRNCRRYFAAGRVSFDIQNAHARRLTNTLLEHQAVMEIDDGYEQTMTDAFPKFTADERELHGIMRSITIHEKRRAEN